MIFRIKKTKSVYIYSDYTETVLTHPVSQVNFKSIFYLTHTNIFREVLKIFYNLDIYSIINNIYEKKININESEEERKVKI